MAIFRRDDPDSPDPRPMAERWEPDRPTPARQPAAPAATIIASGSTVTGEITGTADLRIEGAFEGDIRLDSAVLVGSGGRAQGGITARSVRISGKMVGDVKGLDVVEVTTSGSLEGNVSAARVIIAEGAFFKGKVEMTGGDRGGASKGKGASKG